MNEFLLVGETFQFSFFGILLVNRDLLLFKIFCNIDALPLRSATAYMHVSFIRSMTTRVVEMFDVFFG